MKNVVSFVILRLNIDALPDEELDQTHFGWAVFTTNDMQNRLICGAPFTVDVHPSCQK